jgi:hypothetical protein
VADALANLGYLRLPADIREYTYPRPRARLALRLRKIEVAPVDAKVKILYVRPKAKNDESCIDFARFARCVGRHSDPLSTRFARGRPIRFT